MIPPRVQVIVLQYNNSDDTIKCLNSILGLDYPNFEIVIVDNASKYEHVKEIEQFISNHPVQKSELKVLKLNLGYSGGNNLGIKTAFENKADFVLILNNDVVAADDLLAKLIETANSDNSLGILGPAIDEGNRIVYGGKIKWLKPELLHSASPLKTNFYVPGTAWLIRTEVIRKIGILDQRYFLYFEDVDYAMKAHKSGYRLRIVPEAVVKHTVSSSTRKLGSATLLRYHYRNAHLFNWVHGPIWVKLLLPIWSFFITIKQLAKIVFMPAKRELAEAIIKGVFDFYTGRFGKIADKPINP